MRFCNTNCQGHPRFFFQKAYEREANAFKNTVETDPATEVPQGAEIINSHVIHKLEPVDDGSININARIAPHSNKDTKSPKLKLLLLSAFLLTQEFCFTCKDLKMAPRKIHFLSTFMQTETAKRYLYVLPPRVGIDKEKYWLLLTTSYGNVDASPNCQEHSTGTFR